MVGRTRLIAAVVVVAGTWLALAGGVGAEEKSVPPAPPKSRTVDFVKDLKPLFEASCVSCHGKGKEKGGFNLDTREAFLKGGDTGPAAVVGKGSESLVVKLVAGEDPDLVMPMKGTKWTKEQVGLLRTWIDEGMVWEGAVTFAKPEPVNVKPRVVEVPAASGAMGENPIDRFVGKYFQEKGVIVGEGVEDRVFARRVYLDVWGLLPTVEQLEAFESDQSSGKRQWLVKQLLTDRRKYAEHWLTFWNDLLRNDYRGTGFIDGGRRQISGWLFASLVNNLPYDKFVAELVNPSKASEGFARGIIWRGEVNASMLPPMQAAQNVSQVFMGVNLKCASCHDSFINDWTLADAYGLAAIYSDETLELVHCDKPTGKTAQVRFLYPQVGALDGNLPKEQRTAQLARVMTSRENGRLSRTIVNRLWARLMGRGLVEPVDDMDRAAWEPELLDFLAEDLVAHGYDLKRTIELILTSRAYQLPAVEGVKGKEEFVFRGPLTRRLTAEQFADAVTSFTGEWARMPASMDFDFTAGGLVSAKTPKFIWTGEPVEVGNERATAQALARAEAAAERRRAEAEKKRLEEEKKKEEEAKKKAEGGEAGKADAPRTDAVKADAVKADAPKGEEGSEEKKAGEAKESVREAAASKEAEGDGKKSEEAAEGGNKDDVKKGEESTRTDAKGADGKGADAKDAEATSADAKVDETRGEGARAGARRGARRANANRGAAAKGDAGAKSEAAVTRGADGKEEKGAEKKEEAAPVVPEQVRHRVGFRRTFNLAAAPGEAYAAMLATQSFGLSVNGKPVGPVMVDGQRGGRVQLFDLKPHLKAGVNVVTLDVSSHTEKGLNDTELPLYPNSRNHLNANSGVAFYLNAVMEDGTRVEVVTDENWQSSRSPDDGWRELKFNEEQWRDVTVLAEGARPVDEGPALPPLRRKDFANEPLDVSLSVRSAISTAAQRGGIRAPMLASDALMSALDRPNREQVITVRLTAATTLQALELTNGSSLDSRLKRAGQKMVAEAAKDPEGWVERFYHHALSRRPSEVEKRVAVETLGQPVTAEGVADLLWAVLMLPEFQLID